MNLESINKLRELLKMDEILELDTANLTMLCESGVITKEIDEVGE